MVPRKNKHLKKKKKRWLYLFVPILVIMLGFAGYFLYELKIKQYNVADPVVDQIIDKDFVINFPDGEKIIINKDGEILTGTVGPASETPILDSGNTTNDLPATETNNSPNSTTGSTKKNDHLNKNNPAKPNSIKPTVDTIKQRYMPTLEALQNQANEKINNLVEQAKQEYITKKSSGESISFGYFYNKYYGAAERLESRTDAAFSSILAIIEKELESYGHSKDHAQSFRDEYNATKERRKNNLINEALELF